MGNLGCFRQKVLGGERGFLKKKKDFLGGKLGIFGEKEEFWGEVGIFEGKKGIFGGESWDLGWEMGILGPAKMNFWGKRGNFWGFFSSSSAPSPDGIFGAVSGFSGRFSRGFFWGSQQTQTRGEVLGGGVSPPPPVYFGEGAQFL